MAVTTKYKDKFNEPVVSWVVKLYIEDAGERNSSTGAYTRDREWVDFTDRTESDGKDLLVKISAIQHVTQAKAGTGLSYSKMSSIELDNSDGFFNKPFPSTLTTIYGNTAQWNTTKYGKQTNLHNHKLQVRALVTYDDGHVEEGTLGTFTIAGFQRSNVLPTIKVSLSDLSQPLREKNSAERVRDGLNWYQNRPIKFLLEELLRERYNDRTSSTGKLPTTYVIPNHIDIPTPGTKLGLSSDTRGISLIGRPPDIDADDNIFKDKDMKTRSILRIPTSSTNLSSGIYCGCDNDTGAEIWRYSEANDNYTQVQSASSDWSLAGYFIWRMWYDTDDDRIIFVAVLKSTIDAKNSRKSGMRVYTYDGTTVTHLTTVANGYASGYIDDVFMGDYCYKSGFAYTQTFDLHGGRTSISGYFRTIGWSSDKSTQYGENIPIPFRQDLVGVGNDTTNVGEFVIYDESSLMGQVSQIYGKGIRQGEGEVDGQVYAVFYSGKEGATAPNANGARFSFNQQGFCVWNQDSQCIVYATVVSESDLDADGLVTPSPSNDIKIGLVRFDISGASETTIDGDFDENSVRCDPLSGCSGGPTNRSIDKVYVGSVAWYYDSSTRSRTYIHEIDLDENDVTKIYDSNSDSDNGVKQNFTPIWMAFNDDASAVYPLKVVSFNRGKLNFYDEYTIYSHKLTSENSMKLYYGKKDFKFQPTALTFDSNNVMYFVSNGQMYKYNCYGSGEADSAIERPLLMSSGRTALDDEPYTFVDSLAIDENTRGTGTSAIVYGVSSPIPSVYGIRNGAVAGKYYLWKFDQYLSDRIELADFNGMSRWDAIEKLSMIAGYHAGFDSEGNFVFVNDTQASTADFIIENTSDKKRLQKMTIDSNEKELYNYVQVTPSLVTLESPTAEIDLAVRPDEETAVVHKGTIVLSQKDTKKKRIQLRCLTDGRVLERNIYFIYRVFGDKFDTSLREAGSTDDDHIHIRSGVEDVRKGDTVTITSEVNGTEREEEFTVESDPTDDEKNSGLINIDDTLTYNHPVGSHVEVQKAYDEWSNEFENMIVDPYFEDWDSIQRPTDLNQYTATVSGEVFMKRRGSDTRDRFSGSYFIPLDWVYGKASVAMYIHARTANIPAGQGEGIYQTIPAEKLKGGTTYTVWCYARTTRGGIMGRCASTFRLEVKEGAVSSTYAALPDLSGWTDQTVDSPDRFTLVSGTFTTPGATTDTYSPSDITIGMIAVKSSKAIDGQPTYAMVDGLHVKEGRIAPTDFVIIGEVDKYYDIGNTGAEIMVQGGSASEEAFPWAAGDIINIDCPGLVLKKQDQAKTTSLDTVSIGTYGKKEFSGIQNRFLNELLAEAVSVRVLTDYKWPKYKIQVVIPLTPWLNFINASDLLYRVDIYDSQTFERSGEWKEQCYIQGITHNLSNGTTTLTLRATNYY